MLVLAAPFGNWFPWGLRTLGTYTLARRAGPLLRAWRVLSTVRYRADLGGWVNRLGLPNPGIDAAPAGDGTAVLSLRASSAGEWEELAGRVRGAWAVVELNLSCPNHAAGGGGWEAAVRVLRAAGHRVAAKLPPVGRWRSLADAAVGAGIDWLHASNTIPVAEGGLSGRRLLPLALGAVAWVRGRFGDRVAVTGGGGVRGPAEAAAHLRAGADHVSVASALLNPLNWPRVRRLARALTSRGMT
jgi:dihydroorotate dehydrogenase